MNSKTRRIAVAMSGGIDSSVAAGLLAQAGEQIFGLMMRLWSAGNGRENRCCSPADMDAARKVAHQLGIPFYVMDVRQSFKAQVVDFFVDGYLRGVTPNPCMQCNRHIRWETMLQHARSLGATHMATGHYARIELDNGTFRLQRAVDRNKDQSYVLSVLGQAQLSQTLFPLGELIKSEVRDLVHDMKLPIAERGESQDLCFLGDQDYRSFLSEFSTAESDPGAIVDLAGTIVGEHSGLAQYTIGQRKGLGISAPEPLYVIHKDREKNALIVGNARDRGSLEFDVGRVNWVSEQPPADTLHAQVQVRYRAREMPAELCPARDGTQVSVRLAHPLDDITPGQAAVFYQDSECIGGGIIRQ
jgi:tRNA-specific 2-thiouridylase